MDKRHLENKNQVKRKVDPRVKDVLLLLGAGAFLAASIIMPGLPLVVKPYLDKKIRDEQKEWEKFNTWRLRQVLNRLEKQKDVEIIGGIVKITDRGRSKLLKFDLDQMELRRKRDGKWRLIIYDIANLKKPQRERFRDMLQKLHFFRLQKSVYLTPFVCEEEIEYLRQIFGIDKEVQILKISGIDYEKEYEKYFDL